MYKVSTDLKNYKFNTIKQSGIHKVTWFKMTDSVGYCLSDDEANLVMNYFETRQENFSNIDRLECVKNDCPKCHVIPSFIGIHPLNLILTSQPELSAIPGQLNSSMYISLLTEKGTNNHNYNLTFDLIGMSLNNERYSNNIKLRNSQKKLY